MKQDKLKNFQKQAAGKSLDKRKGQRQVEKLNKEISKVNRRLTLAKWLNFFGCLLVLGVIKIRLV